MVNSRSAAEIPVVASALSTETVKAVPLLSVFSVVINGSCNFFRRSAVSATQIKPRPSLIIKLIFSGVAFSAASTKSPSFSRRSSSTTTTILPARISAIASSIVANATSFTPFGLFKPSAPQFFRQPGSYFLHYIFLPPRFRVPRRQQTLNTFDQVIGLQIELVARLPLQERRNLTGMRDDHGAKTNSGFSRHRQTNTVQRH